MNENQMNNLAFSIKRAFSDDFCEQMECDLCPFFVKATGEINGEDCRYLCDFLYQIKKNIEKC